MKGIIIDKTASPQPNIHNEYIFEEKRQNSKWKRVLNLFDSGVETRGITGQELLPKVQDRICFLNSPMLYFELS